MQGKKKKNPSPLLQSIVDYQWEKMHQLVVLLVCVAWCHAQSSLNLVAAVFTPFNADGSIDVSLETIGQYASVLAKGGVNCAFTCGTNGESLSLTVAERQQVLEAWAKVIAARNLGLKLIGTFRR